jgi:hypothetical protein
MVSVTVALIGTVWLPTMAPRNGIVNGKSGYNALTLIPFPVQAAPTTVTVISPLVRISCIMLDALKT